MKIAKFLLAAALMMTGLTANAQEADANAFKSHWFVQLQGGANYTLGEAKFTKMLSPAAQAAIGYQFTPVWALRLGANGWESKGGFGNDPRKDETYKWNFVTPALDLKFNIIEAFCKYNPDRLFGMNIIAGIGANIGWNNNKNAWLVNNPFRMDDYWTGTKVRPVGRVGLDFDFNVSRRVSINLEAMSNFLSDAYNSKNTDKGCDWYFTGLLGLKVKLGRLAPKAEPVVPVVVEEPTAAPTAREVPKAKPTAARVPEMQTEIFYYIRQTVIRDDQKGKLNNLINFLKANPETKVAVTGYADVETGNPRINMKYSEQRAEGVAKALVDAGINAARITVDAKGDTVQPFSENDKNRVSICIAK